MLCTGMFGCCADYALPYAACPQLTPYETWEVEGASEELEDVEWRVLST